MGQIEDLELFIRVVDAGSVTKAALELNIAKSAVSRRLRLLEQQMGASLIDRAPGRWALTPRGAELLGRARSLVEEAQALAEEFQERRLSLAGPLALSLPRDYGLSFLSPFLARFTAEHGEIDLRLSFDDRFVDLRHESFDAALRINAQPLDRTAEEEVQVTPLGQARAWICASPAYLAAHPALTRSEDLLDHRILGYGNSPRLIWHLAGKPLEVRAALTLSLIHI